MHGVLFGLIMLYMVFYLLDVFARVSKQEKSQSPAKPSPQPLAAETPT